LDLFLKAKSKFYWYDFTVRGERFRGSTKETNETRANKIVALKLAAAIKGSDPLDRRRRVMNPKEHLTKFFTEQRLLRSPILSQRNGPFPDCRRSQE
jgi:hypothetical protein